MNIRSNNKNSNVQPTITLKLIPVYNDTIPSIIATAAPIYNNIFDDDGVNDDLESFLKNSGLSKKCQSYGYCKNNSL